MFITSENLKGVTLGSEIGYAQDGDQVSGQILGSDIVR
jgi:hypothetical protein